jgi:hypothetical protein
MTLWLAIPAMAAGLMAWVVLSSSKWVADTKISMRSDLAVATGAQPDVADYLRLGFSLVGSCDVTTGGHETIFSYLLSADRRTYAVATDRVRCLTSCFGERVMVSISHAATPVPPLELRQLVATTGLDELLEAHEAALEVLASNGRQPDQMPPERVVPFSMEIDRVSMDFILTHKIEFGWAMLWKALNLPPRNAAAIRADQRTASRIDRWAVSLQPPAKTSL